MRPLAYLFLHHSRDGDGNGDGDGGVSADEVFDEMPAEMPIFDL